MGEQTLVDREWLEQLVEAINKQAATLLAIQQLLVAKGTLNDKEVDRLGIRMRQRMDQEHASMLADWEAGKREKPWYTGE